MIKSFVKIINLTAITLILGCRASQKEIPIGICNLSNFNQKREIISSIDVGKLRELNGRFIEINGFLHHYFEDSGLYPTKNSHSKDALWLELIIPDSSLDKLNKKEVKVIGRLNIRRRGHFNGYLASLDSVFCIQEIGE